VSFLRPLPVGRGLGPGALVRLPPGGIPQVGDGPALAGVGSCS